MEVQIVKKRLVWQAKKKKKSLRNNSKLKRPRVKEIELSKK